MLGKTNSFAVTGGTLTVTAPAGATITLSKDGMMKSKIADSSGTAIFSGLSAGTWTVTVSVGRETATDTVEIVTSYAKEIGFYKIYGIYRDITNSSPEWTREEDAVGKTATATVGTVAGSSDFDSCYPWNSITRETLDTGDVMVKIPKFWYRRYREGDIEHIQIADGPAKGFALHPAFHHSGVEQECVYVGAYETSDSNKSVSGATPQGNQSRATFRSNARSKGTGWGLIDISTLSAVQMLILVEFANNNVQDVISSGRGVGDSALKTGTCDSVTNLTGTPAGTSGYVDVVWRGIESLWGNIWEWVDGANWKDGTYYVCNDPSNYADDTAAGYEKLSFTGSTGWKISYITVEGLDTGSNPHVMLPSEAGSGSATTYLCDVCWSNSGWRVVLCGGAFTTSNFGGLFAVGLDHPASDTGNHYGSRLLYIPQQ